MPGDLEAAIAFSKLPAVQAITPSGGSLPVGFVLGFVLWGLSWLVLGFVRAGCCPCPSGHGPRRAGDRVPDGAGQVWSVEAFSPEGLAVHAGVVSVQGSRCSTPSPCTAPLRGVAGGVPADGRRGLQCLGDQLREERFASQRFPGPARSPGGGAQARRQKGPRSGCPERPGVGCQRCQVRGPRRDGRDAGPTLHLHPVRGPPDGPPPGVRPAADLGGLRRDVRSAHRLTQGSPAEMLCRLLLGDCVLSSGCDSAGMEYGHTWASREDFVGLVPANGNYIFCRTIRVVIICRLRARQLRCRQSAAIAAYVCCAILA